MNQKLAIAGILASLVAVSWAWSSNQTAYEAAVNAKANHSKAVEKLDEIESWRKVNASSFRVMNSAYDPSPSVMTVFNKANLKVDSVTPETGTPIGKLNILDSVVKTSPVTVSLRQTINLVQQLANAEANFQMSSVNLSKTPEKMTQEKWNANFEIRFLKREPE